MYFLNQQIKQFLNLVVSYNANPTDGPDGGGIESGELNVPKDKVDSTENLAFKELNEELEGIDNDSSLISKYANILGTFLQKVKSGEYPGLSEEDDDFNRLLELYTSRFKQLNTLRDRGHQIEHIISLNISKLNESVDTVIEGGSITTELDAAFEQEAENNKIEIDQLSSLENEYRARIEAIGIKLSPFFGKENNTNSMEKVVNIFKQINTSVLKDMTDSDKLDFFKLEAISGIQEINRLADIALRDETMVGDNKEKLGEERLDSSHENYNEILENEEIKQALTNSEGVTPTFEELDSDHILILQKKGVNLAKLFLVHEDGSNISEDLEQGKSYIVNFGRNTELAGKLNLAIIARNSQEVLLDGKNMQFEGSQFKSDGKLYPLRDGSKIEIIKKFTDEGSPEQTERFKQINGLLESSGVATTQQRSIREAMISPNPQEAFQGMTLPGGIAGMLMKMFIEFFTDKNFELVEGENIWKEVNGDVLSNEDILNDTMGKYYDNGQRIDVSSSFENLPKGVGSLINTIYQAESNGNPNIIYSGCPIQPPMPITEMSIREVRIFQDRMVAAGSKSSAVGACQIIRDTMDGAISAGVLNPNDKFDMAAQNKFTIWKMNERGLDDFMSGKITDASFMKKLSQEWASLPKDMSGASYYAGDGLNHALVSPQQIMQHLKQIGNG
ncbi:glycoside hydrolase family 104 protein [Candidatus Gracilibacteria bacterium]|nr:glycoside hydrolase family 104 protein [Candidatus Gracilibacteria bacterium]